jgi:hypothetical protein
MRGQRVAIARVGQVLLKGVQQSDDLVADDYGRYKVEIPLGGGDWAKRSAKRPSHFRQLSWTLLTNRSQGQRRGERVAGHRSGMTRGGDVPPSAARISTSYRSQIDSFRH